MQSEDAAKQTAAKSRGLWTRLITAAILGPLVVAEILVPSWGVLLQVTLALFLLVAAREWAALSGVVSSAWQWGYAVALGLAAHAMFGTLDAEVGRLALAAASVATWVVISAGILKYAQSLPASKPGSGPCLVLGVLVLGPFWLSALWLKELDSRLLLAAAALVWLADSLAYFVGRSFGRSRLAPAISPAKTWAGVAGAFLAAPLVTLGLSLFGPPIARPGLPLLGLCVLTVSISIVGDLLESLLKRLAGVKDSGTLLPGHGGVLDRIDSLTAAFPMFYLGISFLGTAA